MSDKNLENNEQSKHIRYLIGDIEVSVAENYLNINGEKVHLEPKVMTLLVYFIEHQNLVLSRDELMAQVWQGTVVSDSALSWSISQLRKALNDKPSDARFIKTISKKGYQFIADVKVLADADVNTDSSCTLAADVNPIIGVNSSSTRYMWLAVPWIIFVAVFAYWIISGEPKERYRLESGSFVTRLDGLEQGGRLSADGKLMLFRYKNTATNGRFQLMLKPMSENVSFAVTQSDGKLADEKAPSRRVQPSFELKGADDTRQFDYKRAIWGVDDYQIIAVRHVFTQNQLAGCEIVRLKLPVNREQVVGEEVLHSCHIHGHSQVSVDRQAKRLFFTDKDDGQIYQLYGLDLDSNNRVTLLDFPNDYVGFGVRFVDYSPHNKRLLVLKDILHDETQFMAMAFDEKAFGVTKQENLFALEAVYYSAYWGPKGRDVWYNWGNDKVLAIDVAGLEQVYGNENQPNKRLHPLSVSRRLLNSANGWNYDAHPVGDNLAVFTVSDANSSDLAFASGDASDKASEDIKLERVRTSFAESFGVFAHNSDTLAFVSNESGWPQIWEKEWIKGGASAKQVTNANRYRQFRDLDYSYDDRYILGVSRTTLGSLDLDNERFRIHYDGPLQPVFPRWFADSKHIVFTAKKDSKWLLYIVEAGEMPQEAKLVGDVAGYVAEPLNDTQVLFNRHDKPGLWLLDINTLTQMDLLAGFPQGVFWRKLGKQVYFVANDKGAKGLYRTVLGDYKPQKVMGLPAASSPYFDIKLLDDGEVKVVFTDYGQYQSDLKVGEIVH